MIPVKFDCLREACKPQSRLSAYRLWLYAFSAILMAMTIIFAIVATVTIREDRMRQLTPITFSTPSVVFLYIALVVQFVMGVIGLVATAPPSHSKLLYLYWWAIIATLIADLIIGLVWVDKMARISSQLSENALQVIQSQYPSESESASGKWFQVWSSLERENHCCGIINGADDYNITVGHEHYTAPSSCHEAQDIAQPLFDQTCQLALRRWFHYMADRFFVLGYALMFLFKLIFVIIMKKEQNELSKEIMLIKDLQQSDGNVVKFVAFQHRPSVPEIVLRANIAGSAKRTQPQLEITTEEDETEFGGRRSKESQLSFNNENQLPSNDLERTTNSSTSS